MQRSTSTSTDRLPRGTNVVYKAVIEALASYPAESHKKIAFAAFGKVKTNLSGSTATRRGSAKVTKSTATRRRRGTVGGTISRSTQTANSIAA